MEKLQGNSETLAADFVFTDGQALATKDGFKNVSKIWYKQTMSYGDGLNKLEQGRAQTEDITATVKEMVPGVEKEKFVMRHKDGRCFTPTVHAVNQMGNWADTGTWYVNSLLTHPTDAKERELYQRDIGDAQTLALVLQNGFRRVDPAKKFLFRTRKDGSLRAMLTEKYAIVDNRWYIERLQEFVPGGRLSHWKGDSDTLYGNVLIPDTIREEKDSDYGGMLSIGNSEIGERRVSSMPSIFRAICMNGCIWGQTKGEGIRQVHRGKIDLKKLASEIQSNLQKQIPLLPQGIQTMLGTRVFGWDGASADSVVAQLAKNYKFSKHQAKMTRDAWYFERMETPDFAATLFGLTNAVTRAGQKLSTNSDWLHFDEIGGELVKYGKDDFERLIGRAKSLGKKEIEEVYGMAV